MNSLPDSIVAELTEEIVAELTDPRFINRTHGTRSTHNNGCNGPMCRKANRDRMRLAVGSSGQKRFIAIDSILERLIEEHKNARQLKTAV